MKYFVLLACIRSIDHSEEFCLVQHLEEQRTADGVQLHDQFDCPLLLLTPDVYLVNPKTVVSSISVAHVCDSGCTLKSCSVEHFVETESVNKHELVFCHNFSNNLYSYNVYCTANNYC